MHIQDKIKLLNRTLYKNLKLSASNPSACGLESTGPFRINYIKLQALLRHAASWVLQSALFFAVVMAIVYLLCCGDGYCLFQKIKWSCGGLMALESHQEGSSSAWECFLLSQDNG